MAWDVLLTLAWACSPPSTIASVMQRLRCSSSRARAQDWSAALAVGP
jgi:hypothetical protein